MAEFVPHRRMVWEGKFHMREDFTGLLAPLITRSIPDLTPSFDQFANGPRALAEDRTR